MNQPKKHHYVPRFYFRPWEREDRKVLVYQRKDSIIIPPYWQSTKVICVKRGLYSYTDLVEESKRNSIESNLFSLIDSNAAKVIQKLYNKDQNIVLSGEERYYLAVFIVSLRIRTPEAFEYNTKDASKILRKELEKPDSRTDELEIKEALNGQSLLEWAEKNQKIVLDNIGFDLMAGHTIDERFVKRILNMDWAIKNISDKFEGNLITSDRPLIQIGFNNKNNFGFAMAISTKQIFIVNEDKNTIDKILSYEDKELVKNMNISTIQQAKEKAFTINDENSIRFFENRLARHHKILPWTN